MTASPGVMTRTQRVVRWAIRLMMPLFVLAGLGGYSRLALIGLWAEDGVSSSWSPGGEYRASVWAVHDGSSCARASFEVRVERRWGPFKRGEVDPFCFAGKASQLEVKWVGPVDLAIICHGCVQDSMELDRTNWGRLHYRYDVQGE